MIKKQHPCDLCCRSEFGPKHCAINCAFYDFFGRSADCYNYECIFHNSDTPCQFSTKCGAYQGSGETDLGFDDDEEDEEAEK